MGKWSETQKMELQRRSATNMLRATRATRLCSHNLFIKWFSKLNCFINLFIVDFSTYHKLFLLTIVNIVLYNIYTAQKPLKNKMPFCLWLIIIYFDIILLILFPKSNQIYIYS